MTCHAWLATPHGAGGVAIIELAGEVEVILEKIAAPGPWPVGKVRLRELASVDTGLVVRITNDRAQLTPHGGPHLVGLLREALCDAGAVWLEEVPDDAYPEAKSSIEGAMLATVAQAQSPAAVKLLLDQPARWKRDDSPLSPEDVARSTRLNRLIDPPKVALLGAPNAGKSTLLNCLVGDETAIVSPEPGTTRDYLGVRLLLGGLAVDWIDTPGVRISSDEIEQQAIQHASSLINEATLVIRIFAPDAPPPPQTDAPEVLCIVNKADLEGAAALAAQHNALLVSALHRTGISDLTQAISQRLVPESDLAHPGRWKFPGCG